LETYSKDIEEFKQEREKFKKENGYYESNPIEWNGYSFNELGTIWKYKNQLFMMVADFAFDYFLKKDLVSKLKEGKTTKEIGFRRLYLPLQTIQFYRTSGVVKQYTQTTGGGSSLSGAIIGGIVAGDVGAIIGSRKESKVETFTNDERKVEMFVKVKDEVTVLYFSYKALDALLKTIPEKDFDYIKATSKV
jgi:hypothetical protein